MPLKLANVTVIGEQLALSFEDGTEMYHPLAMLRRACPCAACQGEPDALGRVVQPMVEYSPKAFELSGIEVVGGYGLQLRWADSHNTGIFSFDYLQRLAELPDA